MPAHINPETISEITRLLGREPRGLRDVPVVSDSGKPQVIRVASIVDGKPFPTLFWLIDPAICLRIDRDEAGGLIAVFQARVDSEPELRAQMVEDHRSHIALRDSYLSDEERQVLDGSGFDVALTSRGIGGIADFGRIRCLHTWYGAHLVHPNTIGRMLDEYWASDSTVVKSH
ncbi:MAG: DUF501 domain-containing protein [Halioglobus sp.]